MENGVQGKQEGVKLERETIGMMRTWLNLYIAVSRESWSAFSRVVTQCRSFLRGNSFSSFLFSSNEPPACLPSDFTKRDLHMAEQKYPGLQGKQEWVPVSAVLTKSEGKFSNLS